MDTCTEGTLPLTTALRDSEAVRLESIQDVSFNYECIEFKNMYCFALSKLLVQEERRSNTSIE